MPKLKKDMMNILDAKQRADGFKRFQDWLADHPEARKEAKKAILEINKKYHMIVKLDTGE